MAVRVETARMDEGESSWWTWGIYASDGCTLLASAGEESYSTEEAARAAADQYLCDYAEYFVNR